MTTLCVVDEVQMSYDISTTAFHADMPKVALVKLVGMVLFHSDVYVLLNDQNKRCPACMPTFCLVDKVQMSYGISTIAFHADMPEWLL